MSDRRRVDPAAIDEALIRELVGGYSPALLRNVSQSPPPSQAESVSCPPEKDAANKLSTTDYARIFLQPKKIKERATCVMALQTKRKLMLICQRLGCGLSLTALVDNILSHHLETYRNEINAMIKNANEQI